ncbi:NAD(P)-dependent oxidoreductase [Occultella glacieicola]|uniref:NAD(P)-dependent oxidoreductase n=1 Tax=Occultella glacieicola TaxID=2518684 RepID=A0ABY2E9P2_9MICO|nr:NAD(P)-binding domain-containing protein [Occultella glacieicola]TDE95985.1 NAD(P)-dependent oxidoreductase [Occultella glacieicola]
MTTRTETGAQHQPATTVPVTVLGLGPMGQAMGHVLLAAGHPVTVWNRTSARADTLVSAGATPAPDPGSAVASSELVILSLTDYQAMYDILGDHTDALRGRLLVNLSSDTPERTREAADWAGQHGARFLTGGVMTPPPTIGTEGAYVYYSGPRPDFEAHSAALSVIGEPRYVGEDPGLAQLLYQAQLDVFLTGLAGLLHATALAGSGGVSAAEFVPQALETLTGIPAMIEDGDALGTALDARSHPGDLGTTTMMGATADHIAATSAAAGLDLVLPDAVASLYRRAIRAGHGADNWTSLIEVIRAGVLTPAAP